MKHKFCKSRFGCVAQSGSVSTTALLIAAAVLFVLAGVLLYFFRAPARQSSPPRSEPPAATVPVQNPQAGSLTAARSLAASSRSSNTKTAPELLRATDTNSPTGLLIEQLLSENVDNRIRRQAAAKLAKIDSEEAFAALQAALTSPQPLVRTRVAEVLGESPRPEALALLKELIGGQDEVLARAAVRGLATRDNTDTAQTLGNVLLDGDSPDSVREEAALALGEVTDPAALSALSRALNEIQDEDLLSQVLEGLGNRPFAETESTFRTYLSNPDLSTEAKVTALEALAGVEGNVEDLLTGFATDPSEEVRVAASWALASADTQEDKSSRVLEWAGAETSAEVRSNLYEALADQEQYDPNAILALAQRETEPEARLSALEMVAAAYEESNDPGLGAYFNQTAVPELKGLALTSANTDPTGSTAVVSLLRAGTPEALQALRELAVDATSQRVRETAERALNSHGPH